MEQDYYIVLGVNSDAEPEVIAAAYKALAKKYHPDVSDDRNAERRLQQLNEAYATLRDPKLRSEYDRRMAKDVYGEADVGDVLSATEPQMTFAGAPDSKSEKQVGISSILSDVLYLLIGVPVFWTIAVFVCDVLISTVMRAGIELLGPNEFGLSTLASAAVEVASARFNAWTGEPEIKEVSLLTTAFTAVFMFICVKAATSAVVEHTHEEKPHIRAWMTFASIFGFFAFLAIRNSPDPTSMPQSLVAKEWAVWGAMFAAVLSSFREATGKR